MPENVNVFAMNLGELETEVLKKLWISVSEDSNGWPPDSAFVKYSKYRVRKKINQVYSEMVAYTNSLKSWFIVPLTVGYHQYPVPLNCFDIESVYYFSSATAYSELEVYDEETIEDTLSPGWKTQTGTPTYAYVGDRARMVIKLGIAPPPSASATSITLAATLDTMDQPYGALEAVSGHAAIGSGTNIYVDAHGQNFDELGVTEGLTILNITDGSKGVITSITTTNTTNDTLTCSANLSGGSVNVWTAADDMRIVGGEYGGIISIGNVEAQYILAPNAGQLPKPSITMAANNLLVQGYFYPILLVDDYQYPELTPMFHPYIALGAAALLGKEEPVDSGEYAQSLKYEEEYNKNVGLLTGFTAAQFKGDVNLWSRNR